jgi:SIR2-like domain
MADAPTEMFYDYAAELLRQGKLTPFLGAGINYRAPETVPPQRWSNPPSTEELAKRLADRWGYRGDLNLGLVHISQWVKMHLGSGELYQTLHDEFDHDFSPTVVHALIVRIPVYVRRLRGRFPLVVTTNYDDALERALAAAGEPFDLLTYLATGREQGKFVHTLPGGEHRLIKVPNRYARPFLTERPVIVKLHGAVRRHTEFADDDSYVVTEDDYIDVLTRTELSKMLPSDVVARMKRCHYLFLGYSLKDWNLRAMLHRIRLDSALEHLSWAIQRSPEQHEVDAWKSRNVQTFSAELSDVAGTFRAVLDAEIEKTTSMEGVG